jgi:sarcosine oxidase
VRRAEVVVVGAGVNGLAAARALAAAGRETLVLERFEVGNRRASSHGASRIFRLSHDRAHEVAEALRALALWRRLEQEARTQLLELHGSLDIGRDFGAHVEALRSEGVPFEVGGADEVRRRFGIAIAEESGALVQLDGGIIWADRALGALRRSAEARGAVVREGERALRLDADSDGVTVETAEWRVEAEVVVVAAGPWAAGLLRDAGVELDATPTRETVVYFTVEGPPVPSLIDWLVPDGYSFAREPIALYALHAPRQGLKVGIHHAGPVTDPEAEGEVDREAVRLASNWVAERFLNAKPHAVAAETCLYTSNPGLEPVVEAHGRIIVASSCNGHGFKFAPGLGDTVAGLVAAAVEATSDRRHRAGT